MLSDSTLRKYKKKIKLKSKDPGKGGKDKAQSKNKKETIGKINETKNGFWRLIKLINL